MTLRDVESGREQVYAMPHTCERPVAGTAAVPLSQSNTQTGPDSACGAFLFPPLVNLAHRENKRLIVRGF